MNNLIKKAVNLGERNPKETYFASQALKEIDLLLDGQISGFFIFSCQ